MTDLRQAAQQALGFTLRDFATVRDFEAARAALHDVLRTALEQQQAEPTCPDCKAAVLYECVACSSNNYPPQQQAEPVTREGFEKWAKFAAPYMDISRFEAGYSDCNTDYAWVGWQAAQRKELSASEILDMMPSGIPAEYDGELMEFARAVEAKIKERNHDR